MRMARADAGRAPRETPTQERVDGDIGEASWVGEGRDSARWGVEEGGEGRAQDVGLLEARWTALGKRE